MTIPIAMAPVKLLATYVPLLHLRS